MILSLNVLILLRLYRLYFRSLKSGMHILHIFLKNVRCAVAHICH